jgi:DNA-binding NtrC family response regulator
MSIQSSELFKTGSSSRWLANQAGSSANMIEKMIRDELRRGDFSKMPERVVRIEELVNEHVLESGRERELLLLAAVLLEGGGETRAAYRFAGRLLAEKERLDQAFLSRLRRFRIRLALNRGDLMEARAEVSLTERVVMETLRGLGEVNETVDQEDVSKVTVATWLLSAEVSLAEKRLDQALQDLSNARSCMNGGAQSSDESVMFELLSALVCVNLDDTGGAPALAYLYQRHVNQGSESQVQALTSARVAAAAGDMRHVNGISESEALRWRGYGPDPDVVEHYLREGAPAGTSEALLEKLPSPHELIAVLDENLIELRRNDAERQVRPVANVDLLPLSVLFEYFPLEEITGMFDYNGKTGQLEIDWSSCNEAIVREAVEVGAVSDVALRCKGGTIYLHDGSYVDASLHSSEAELRAMSAVDVIFELFRISSARLPGAGIRQFQSGAEGTRISEVINLKPNKLNLDLARRLDHLRSGKSDEAVADDELDLDSAFAAWETPGQLSRMASETTSESEDSEREVNVSVGDLSSLGAIVSSPDVVSLELSVVQCLAEVGVSDSRIEIVVTESGERLRECGLSPALCDVWGTYEVGMCTVALALRKGVRVLNPESVDVIMKVAVQRLRTLPSSHLAVKMNAPGFIAEDPRSQKVLSQLRDIAVLDGVDNAQKITHVLLLGERGVGKELIAKLIHDWSRRSREKYHVINLGAIARELAVAELFGSKKGSFTSSVADRIGYIQKAENGTLFVDELDEGSDSMQALLKRVVQFGTYNVVGSPHERLCNVRFIAASNRVLAIKPDLKDRFWIVEVPALRERRADIAPLAQSFASQHEFSLPEPVLSYLTGLRWPGNVRQLQTVVHRVCAIAKAPDEVTLAAFESAVRESGSNPGVSDFGTDQFPPLRVGETLRDRLNAQEQWQIQNALRFTNWNKTATARLLGISRPNLRERMKALGMSMEKPQDSGTVGDESAGD